MASYDDLPIQRITVISLIAIAVTVVSILAVQVLYYGMNSYVNQSKLAADGYTESEEYLARQSRGIERFAVNDDDGHYVIPIEQAMKKIVREASATNENQSNTNNET